MFLGGGGGRYPKMFFATGKNASGNTTILRSRDGKRWLPAVSVPASYTSNGQSVCRATNGLLFASVGLGPGGLKGLWQSADNGKTWTVVNSLTFTNCPGDVAFGGGILAVIDFGGSSGGGVWRSANLGTSFTFAAATDNDNGNLVYGNGYFVRAGDLTGGGNSSHYSADASAWTATSIAGAGVSFVNGLFGLCGYGSGSSYDTTLALSWSANPTVAAGSWTTSSINPQTYQIRSSNHVAYLNGTYVANDHTGTSKATSLAGSWTSLGIGNSQSQVIAGNGVLLITDGSGTAYHYTTDVSTFTAVAAISGLTTLGGLSFC